VKAETLRAQGERLNEELGREAWRAGAGLTVETRFAEIFERHAAVAGDAAWEAARSEPMLAEWVADNRVGRQVAALEDRLHTWESGAVVTLPDGERLPFQKVGIAVANSPQRARRLALDAARRAVLAEPTAIRAERLRIEAAVLDQLTGLGVVEARTRLSGIDLDDLAAQCDAFLAGTRDPYRDVLGEHLRAIGVRSSEAHRTDGAFLFRAADYDQWFDGAALVPTARRQVGEMGLDVDAGGRVHLDTEERERKRPRAFCAPVRVPAEVHLVIRPHGGYTDWRAFWHELGHALHFANALTDLPFEHRWLGDSSVTECYAMLFEHTLMVLPWLRRYTALAGEPLARFLRDQAFAQLAIVRRYAAKLRYEVGLHRAPSLAEGACRYTELLSDATGFRYDDQDALLDLDDGFYAARYLRAWQLEATLRETLVERFDEDWFRNPRTGPMLLELFGRGQRDDADTLARSVVGAPLGFGPLTRQVTAALA